MPIHDWTRVSAGVFHDFHLAWTVHLSASFNNGALPPEYYSMVEQHAGRSMDDVLSTGINDSASLGRRLIADEAAMYRELRRTVAIRRATTHRLVAMIEIVSPGNKDKAANVVEFVDKAREALRVGCHLVVIDLFPPASHDPSGMHEAIWEANRDAEDDSVVKPSTALLASYVASHRLEAYVEAIAIGQALPEMPLFLETNRYVNVPLESTYQAAYRGMPEVWRNVLEAS